MTERWTGLLRDRSQEDAPVTSFELFFDLVYALAITQLTGYLLANLTLEGAARSLMLLVAVWLAWNYTAWFTNYFDPDKLPIRLVLILLTLTSLGMSGSLPEAFGAHGLVFAVAYAAIQIIRTAFSVAALGHHALGPVFQRSLVWWSATGLLWLTGGLADGQTRVILWAIAIALDALGVLIGFPVPGLGRSHTVDYSISGGHMAERCQAFVMMAIGESIVITGRHFDEVLQSATAIVAFIIAFVGSVALWAVYFNWEAAAGRRAIARAANPGKLAVSAFRYFHVPIVAGIVVSAAADELTITHPTAAVSFVSTALIVGGPALFLAGSALYSWSIDAKTPTHRLAGLVAFAVLVSVSSFFSQLILSGAATVIVLGVATWDVLAPRAQRFEASP